MAKRAADNARAAGLTAEGGEACVSVVDDCPAPFAASNRNLMLRRLVEENHDALIAYLRRRLSSRAEADDLAQDVYCRIAALRSSGALKDPRAYLFQAARNLLTDRARGERRRKARAHLSIDEARDRDVICEAPSPEQSAQSRLRLEAVTRALSELAPNCRAAFLMVRFEERSYKEVAARLGVSVKTVEHYMRQALSQIQSRVDVEAPARAREAAE